MNIDYFAKNVYGKENFYPIASTNGISQQELSALISLMKGKITIDKYDIEDLRVLGITCTEVLPVRN